MDPLFGWTVPLFAVRLHVPPVGRPDWALRKIVARDDRGSREPPAIVGESKRAPGSVRAIAGQSRWAPGSLRRLPDNPDGLPAASGRLSDNPDGHLGASDDCRRITSGSGERGWVDLPSRPNISPGGRAYTAQQKVRRPARRELRVVEERGVPCAGGYGRRGRRSSGAGLLLGEPSARCVRSEHGRQRPSPGAGRRLPPFLGRRRTVPASCSVHET